MYKLGLLKKIRKHLGQGGVIAYPTESCYGFGCDPFNYQAIKNLLSLKRRNTTKGLIVIASRYPQLTRLVKPLNTADKMYIFNNYWPGPYSLILPVKNNTLPILTGYRDSIALRITNHATVRQLNDYLGMALTSTSANISGYKAIKSYKVAKSLFGKKVMVLPGRIGHNKKPSTIINWATKQIMR